MTNDLIKLMQEHPDYPVVARVDSDVCYEADQFLWYLGNFGSAEIGELLIYHEFSYTAKVYTERRHFIEDWQDENYRKPKYSKLSSEEFEEIAKKVCDEQNWRKVIFVNIYPFDEEDILYDTINF